MLRLAPLALALGLLLAGCANKFTRDRFEMIEAQVDDREDVEHILGTPERRLSDEWFYENEDEHYAARIFFDEAGRVRGKEWIDGKTGEWEGSHPDAAEAPAGETREERTKTRRIEDD